ncbi:helix-hairpin-helix domain-containing protein [Pseudactinotalea sp.]|uniref:helix-hairpin-helix domain-containing protein n=1 Tax=Pseudactinotalea sp. TaxID=1926260 RepID=UPI003B3B0C13
MRDEAGARLRRYLRVAYDGAPEPELPERAPHRWAAPGGAAVRIAALLVVLVVAAVTYLVLARIPPAPAAPDAPSAEPSAPVIPDPTTAPEGSAVAEEPHTDGSIVVHVAGAVVEPGLVEVSAGSRVAEAIQRAGGGTDEADLDALNLAAPLADGQQVYVPREGEAVPPAAAGGGDSPGTETGLVDLNTADAAALETLPGIGPALAERILSWRTENGPFPSVDALTNVSGIGPATLARLRDLVTV